MPSRLANQTISAPLGIMTLGFSYSVALTALTHIQLCAACTALRLSIAPARGQGILTLCPSHAAFAICLGPANPWLIISAKETSVFRCTGFSPVLWLLVPAFSLPNAPEWVTPYPSSRFGTLSYQSILPKQNLFLSFGTVLSPDYLRRKSSR